MQKAVDWNARTYVMGILNLTPDSFSGDGLLHKPQNEYLNQAQTFIEAGVDILDIGGESSRPGARAIDETEEIARIQPVILGIRRNFPSIQISIDTYKAAVAQAALDAGANIVNDVWGLRGDPALADLVAAKNVPVILMHNRLLPASQALETRMRGQRFGTEYTNMLAEVKQELWKSIEIAHAAGIRDSQIILDPGLGFGKTASQSLELLNRVNEIRALGYPVLIGPSRKGFIGKTLNLPPGERVEGTAAAIAIGIARGANIIRVHDVGTMVRIARMSDAILHSGRVQD